MAEPRVADAPTDDAPSTSYISVASIVPSESAAPENALPSRQNSGSTARKSTSKKSKSRKTSSKKSSSKTSSPYSSKAAVPSSKSATGSPSLVAKALPYVAAIAPAAGLVFWLVQQLRNRKGVSKSTRATTVAQQAPSSTIQVRAKDVFTDEGDLLPPTTGTEPRSNALEGLTFSAAEDLDVAGCKSGFGVTIAREAAQHATSTSEIIAGAHKAGASLRGRTIVQEFNLELVNTASPANPLIKKRITGIGSIGAALATTGGLVDFAFGTDSIGGMRVPAACCGTYAFRPSTNPPSGISALPSISGRSPTTLLKVASAATAAPGKPDLKGEIIRIYVAEDLFRMCDQEMRPAVTAAKLAIQKWAGEEHVGQFNLTQFLSYHLNPAWKEMMAADEPLPPAIPPVMEALRRAAVELYVSGLRQQYGEQYRQYAEATSEDTSALMADLCELSEDKVPTSAAVAADMHKMLKEALKSDTVVVLPVTPSSPLPLDAPPEIHQAFFKRVQMFNCIASLGACPTVVIPAGRLKDGSPLAVALISQPKTDLRLLAVAEKLAPIIQEQFVRVQSGELEREAKEEEERRAAAEKKRLEEDKQLEKADKHKAKGNELFASGQYEKAIQQYSLAIKLYPRSPVFYSNRALVHLKMFNWEAAEDDCTLALQHSTGDKVAVKALLRRASARRALSNFRGAVADLNQVLVLEPNNQDAKQEKGSILQEVQLYQQQQLRMQAANGGAAGMPGVEGGYMNGAPAGFEAPAYGEQGMFDYAPPGVAPGYGSAY